MNLLLDTHTYYHKDWFDDLLIAQVMVEGVRFILVGRCITDCSVTLIS